MWGWEIINIINNMQYSYNSSTECFYTPNEKDFSLLVQAVKVLLGFKAIEHREQLFPQFFYSSLEVAGKDVEMVNHKLQLLGWQRV